MRKQAKELSHLLIHKPRRPYCEHCVRAQLRESPHRRSAGVTKVVTNFGDIVTGAFLTSQDDSMRGAGGWRHALDLRDLIGPPPVASIDSNGTKFGWVEGDSK